MWAFSIFLAIFCAFLQSTFLPAISIYGGAIEISLVVVLIFLFFGRLREASIFLLVSALFSSLFSGVPVIYQILPEFLIVAIYVFLDYKRVFFRPNTLLALPVFILAVVLADFSRLVLLREVAVGNIQVLIANALYTAIFGTGIFYITNKIFHLLNPHIMRDRIKLGR